MANHALSEVDAAAEGARLFIKELLASVGDIVPRYAASACDVERRITLILNGVTLAGANAVAERVDVYISSLYHATLRSLLLFLDMIVSYMTVETASHVFVWNYVYNQMRRRPAYRRVVQCIAKVPPGFRLHLLQSLTAKTRALTPGAEAYYRVATQCIHALSLFNVHELIAYIPRAADDALFCYVQRDLGARDILMHWFGATPAAWQDGAFIEWTDVWTTYVTAVHSHRRDDLRRREVAIFDVGLAPDLPPECTEIRQWYQSQLNALCALHPIAGAEVRRHAGAQRVLHRAWKYIALSPVSLSLSLFLFSDDTQGERSYHWDVPFSFEISRLARPGAGQFCRMSGMNVECDVLAGNGGQAAVLELPRTLLALTQSHLVEAKTSRVSLRQQCAFFDALARARRATDPGWDPTVHIHPEQRMHVVSVYRRARENHVACVHMWTRCEAWARVLFRILGRTINFERMQSIHDAMRHMCTMIAAAPSETSNDAGAHMDGSGELYVDFKSVARIPAAVSLPVT